MSSTFSRIAARDRIPFGQKLAFAAGVNTDYVSNGLLKSMLLMPFFNIGMGMNPAVIGAVLMIFRAWDAITDPVMGNISDNTRTRWGRRRPFMFSGAIATAAAYPLFWYMPAAWEPAAKAVWLTLTGVLFYSCFTLWSMPYYSMQLELTPDYDERTRLAAWMALFGKLFWLCAGWFFVLVMLLGSLATGAPGALEGKSGFVRDVLAGIQPWLASFASPAEGEKPIVAGMRIACWLIVAAILVFGMLPALFVRERYYRAEARKQPRDPFWQSLRESFRNVPLWLLIGTSFFLTLGTASVTSLGQYMNFYYVNHGDLDKAAVIGGVKMTTTVIVGIACLPLLTKLGERFDKRSVVTGMLACSMFGHLLNYVCLTPDYPYLQIVPAVFESCGLGAIWMFLPSMKGDVADYDEMSSLRRREGSINAFYSWFVKVAATISLGIGGLVLQVSGFDAKLAGQPPEVLGRMFAMYLVLPVVIWCLALALVRFYPLTRARAEQIRDELEARRGKI
ncbi:MAG: MFS transporter [Opitutaceae bacterium]|jgi:GPH family glycoside/pentoside/hexuronide:cation symporter|nr:MFS transporter [Opitutaceae bacterium]